jgi:hypothetical protein
VTIDLVLLPVDGVSKNDEWREVPVCPPPRGGPGRGRRKDGDGLEGRERNGRHHEFGCTPRNRPRGAETEWTGGRTTGHYVCG